jgi:ribosomal protein S18 acetylase RimI-like enzyme
MQSRFSIEQEVDDIMWEEFEDDPTPIPTGLASLPWTEEYRAASRAADQRVARRKEVLQMELEDAPTLWELSSVYVIPEYRRRGVGSELVRQVLTRQYAQNKQGKDVYALTLAKNVKWYTQFGFKIEEQVPDQMMFEMNAGKVITKLIGEELVCIRTQL